MNHFTVAVLVSQNPKPANNPSDLVTLKTRNKKDPVQKFAGESDAIATMAAIRKTKDGFKAPKL